MNLEDIMLSELCKLQRQNDSAYARYLEYLESETETRAVIASCEGWEEWGVSV